MFLWKRKVKYKYRRVNQPYSFSECQAGDRVGKQNHEPRPWLDFWKIVGGSSVRISLQQGLCQPEQRVEIPSYKDQSERVPDDKVPTDCLKVFS